MLAGLSLAPVSRLADKARSCEFGPRATRPAHWAPSAAAASSAKFVCMALIGKAAAAVLLNALVAPGFAHAALTCEQLFAVAQTTERYRDQGYTLAQVLDALKSVDRDGKLGALELEFLRRAVTATYLGHASPGEIAVECARSSSGADSTR
jgi:hypothetical protein